LCAAGVEFLLAAWSDVHRPHIAGYPRKGHSP
jgi:hypothetical protein